MSKGREVELAAEDDKIKLLKDTDELTNVDWDPVDDSDGTGWLVELAEHMDKCYELKERIAEVTFRKKKTKGHGPRRS